MTSTIAPTGERRALILGVGAFAQAAAHCLSLDGFQVATYLTRPYGHYGPQKEAVTVRSDQINNPCAWITEYRPEVIVPMSLEWALKPWSAEFLAQEPPILCPTGEALRLERERDWSRELCERHGIPFARSVLISSRREAEAWVRHSQRGWVIKNPLCSPTSPIHTIVCESPDDTLSWLQRIDDSEGIFLQEYLGRREIGHIALVSGGEIHSLVTNQEYKRAFDGNLGIVAGAPLGGLVERDSNDKYGLADQLLRPLLPWFRQVAYHGPVQVTAMFKEGRWQVLEYNVRLGVTSGPLIFRMLSNLGDTLVRCARNRPLEPAWRVGAEFGCSLTLAGYGYPFTQLMGPRVPLQIEGTPTCDLWWQEVELGAGQLLEAAGHRLVDVAAVAETLSDAITTAYANIRRLRSIGSYYRTDVGKTLWPPGNE